MTGKQETAPAKPWRQRLRPALGRIVGLAILLAAVGLAIYVVYYLDQSPRTDDAYVRADTIGVAQARQAADTLARIEPLLAKEYVTPEQVDQARTARRSADAALQVARRDAERAAAAVSGVDALVAKLGELRAAVAMAEYDLEQTVVRAPFDGTVIDLNIAEGEFAATGRRLFTLIDTQNWYVIANFRETALNRIRPGMAAELYLMSDPSRRFAGTVHSIGFGVFPEEGGASANGLPRVPRSINWVRVAQRFPVRIRVDEPQADLFRIGASAVALIPPERAQAKRASLP